MPLTIHSKRGKVLWPGGGVNTDLSVREGQEGGGGGGRKFVDLGLILRWGLARRCGKSGRKVIWSDCWGIVGFDGSFGNSF